MVTMCCRPETMAPLRQLQRRGAGDRRHASTPTPVVASAAAAAAPAPTPAAAPSTWPVGGHLYYSYFCVLSPIVTVGAWGCPSERPTRHCSMCATHCYFCCCCRAPSRCPSWPPSAWAWRFASWCPCPSASRCRPGPCCPSLPAPSQVCAPGQGRRGDGASMQSACCAVGLVALELMKWSGFLCVHVNSPSFRPCCCRPGAGAAAGGRLGLPGDHHRGGHADAALCRRLLGLHQRRHLAHRRLLLLCQGKLFDMQGSSVDRSTVTLA